MSALHTRLAAHMEEGQDQKIVAWLICPLAQLHFLRISVL
jgi:hypothetical protein